MRRLAKKIKEVLFHPVKFLAKNTDGYREIFQYLLLIALVPAIISAAIYYVSPDADVAFYYSQMGITIDPVLLFFLVYIDAILTFLTASVVMHLFVYIWGGRYGLRSTARAVAFSYTPYLLFGWIPFVYYVSLVWALVLLVLGLKEQHKIPAAHAIGALLTPIVSLILLFAISAMLG